MPRSRTGTSSADRRSGLSFLLSQVGAHSSSRFAERLEPLRIKPAHVGILRVVAQTDGLSQQALGENLGVFPSRLVAILDELEGRGLLERRHSPVDRRSYALYLTPSGREILERIAEIAREHQDALCAALNEVDQAQLADLLGRIAAEQGLKPGVHPGFRKFADGEPK